MLPYKAVPTRYAGVNFRSRLEARWAALFNQRADLKWSYEPVDFDGWIPDFQLTLFNRPRVPVFIEIKPVIENFGVDPLFAKAIRHSQDVQVVLLGLEPCVFGTIGCVLDPPSNSDYSWADICKRFVWAELPERWREAGNRVQWRGPSPDG